MTDAIRKQAPRIKDPSLPKRHTPVTEELTPQAMHKMILENAKQSILDAHNKALLEGKASHSLIGVAWDLRDPLLPAPILERPAAQQILKSVQNMMPSQLILETGVYFKQEISEVFTPLAYGLDKLEVPLIISGNQSPPSLIQIMLTHREPNTLLVLILAGQKVSLQALPISAIVKPVLALPPRGQA